MRLDIDEYINKDLIEFVKNFKGDKDLYSVYRKEIINEKEQKGVNISTIYKNNETMYWENRIHETLIGYKNNEILPNNYLIIHSKNSKRCKKQAKFYWDNWEEQREIIKNESK